MPATNNRKRNGQKVNTRKNSTGTNMEIVAEHKNASTTENIKLFRTDERTFNLVVDDVPYLIKASPFTFNGTSRFYVNINGGDDHIFTWDSELAGLRAIDDNASILPDALEEAISHKLQSKNK